MHIFLWQILKIICLSNMFIFCISDLCSNHKIKFQWDRKRWEAVNKYTKFMSSLCEYKHHRLLCKCFVCMCECEFVTIYKSIYKSKCKIVAFVSVVFESLRLSLRVQKFLRALLLQVILIGCGFNWNSKK